MSLMKQLPKFLVAAGLIAASTTWASGGGAPKIEKRATKASYVLNEWDKMETLTAIPESLMAASECVLVVPEVIKAGFVVGGRLGYGIASCRTNSGWGAPVYYQLTGASWGLIIGIESSDMVFVFPRDNAK